MRGHSVLPGGWFLSRHCFTLCITVEVESRIGKQYKSQYCCSYKNYHGKGMEGGKKVSLCHFLADQKIGVCRKKQFWGILQHEQQVTAYFQTHYDYGPPKMPLKLAVKNSQIHCRCLPLWRKYAPEVKVAKGLKRCWAKVRSNTVTTLPESPNRHGPVRHSTVRLSIVRYGTE